jgi:hypothetical protein
VIEKGISLGKTMGTISASAELAEAFIRSAETGGIHEDIIVPV